MPGKIPFYHRFSNKLAFWTLSIFVLGQVLTLWAINQTSHNNANTVIEQSVNVAEAIFQKAYHDRSEMLSNSIEVLAADHGFKGAIAFGFL